MELNLDWRREDSEVWPSVSYELRPLKVWAFQELLDYWERYGKSGSDEATEPVARPSEGVKLMDVAVRIFPEHVRGVQGLTVNCEGQSGQATVEMLCEETQLLPLAGEIVSRLVAISEVGTQDEKN